MKTTLINNGNTWILELTIIKMSKTKKITFNRKKLSNNNKILLLWKMWKKNNSISLKTLISKLLFYGETWLGGKKKLWVYITKYDHKLINLYN